MKKITSAILAMTAAAAMSCSDKDIISIDDNNSQGLNIKVGVNSQIETRSKMLLENEQFMLDGESSLVISCEEKDFPRESDALASTKGITQANSNFIVAGSKFMLFMYDLNTPMSFKDSAYVKYDGTKWVQQKPLNSLMTMPDDTDDKNRAFWAYPKSSEISGTSSLSHRTFTDKMEMEFDYAASGTTGQTSSDLIFANAQIGTSTELQPTVNLDFYHALSGIQFRIGDLGIDQGLQVEKIELVDILSKGTCRFDPSKPTNPEKFIWTPNTDPSSKKTYSQDYTMGISEYAKNKNLDKSTDSVMTFFVMPQTLSDDVKLKVYFRDKTVGGDTLRIMTKQFNQLGLTTIPAGKLYAYHISGGGKISMVVNYDDGTKAYSVTNTGHVKGYVRASVVGNWYDSSSKIAFPWSVAASGLTLANDDWYRAPDGFFYYKYPLVTKGETTTPLFKAIVSASPSYDNIGTTHAGYTLKIEVAAQMVRFADQLGTDAFKRSYADAAWGAANTYVSATNSLKATPKP